MFNVKKRKKISWNPMIMLVPMLIWGRFSPPFDLVVTDAEITEEMYGFTALLRLAMEKRNYSLSVSS